VAYHAPTQAEGKSLHGRQFYLDITGPGMPIAPAGSPDSVARGMGLGIHAEQMIGYGLLVGQIESCWVLTAAPSTGTSTSSAGTSGCRRSLVWDK